MTDRPYTDDDLRAEAARQHAALIEDPDFMGIGEQMENAPVEHTDDGETSLTWTELLVPQGAGASYEAFGEAQEKIHGLIRGAADTSRWAVNLGADGLVPSTEHQLTLDGDSKPIVRIHFAFEPGMSDGMKNALVTGLARVIAAEL